MPKRFSTLRVSMVCNAGTSTRSSECSGLKGILVVLVEWRVSCWVPCVASRPVLVYADERYGRVGLAVGKCYVSARIGR